MPEDDDKTEGQVFIPRMGRVIRNWFLIDLVASVALFFLIRARSGGNGWAMIWFPALIVVGSPVLGYLLFLTPASGAIEVTSEGSRTGQGPVNRLPFSGAK